MVVAPCPAQARGFTGTQRSLRLVAVRSQHVLVVARQGVNFGAGSGSSWWGLGQGEGEESAATA